MKAGKIRESGMPPEEFWARFFNVNKIIDEMKIDSEVKEAADFLWLWNFHDSGCSKDTRNHVCHRCRPTNGTNR